MISINTHVSKNFLADLHFVLPLKQCHLVVESPGNHSK